MTTRVLVCGVCKQEFEVQVKGVWVWGRIGVCGDCSRDASETPQPRPF